MGGAFRTAPVGVTGSFVGIAGFAYSLIYAVGLLRIPHEIPYALKSLTFLIATGIAILFAWGSSELYKAHRGIGFLFSLMLCFVFGVALANLLADFGFTSGSPYVESMSDGELWALRLTCFAYALLIFVSYFLARLYDKDFRRKEEVWWGPGGGFQFELMAIAFSLPYIVGIESDLLLFGKV